MAWRGGVLNRRCAYHCENMVSESFPTEENSVLMHTILTLGEVQQWYFYKYAITHGLWYARWHPLAFTFWELWPVVGQKSSPLYLARSPGHPSSGIRNLKCQKPQPGISLSNLRPWLSNLRPWLFMVLLGLLVDGLDELASFSLILIYNECTSMCTGVWRTKIPDTLYSEPCHSSLTTIAHWYGYIQQMVLLTHLTFSTWN